MDKGATQIEKEKEWGGKAGGCVRRGDKRM